ncbi:MAG TPA: diguanylate cyclase [Candidatus Limnocylindrales bacterium]
MANDRKRVSEPASRSPDPTAPDGTRVSRVLAAAPIGLFETDAEGQCVYVNERWCRLTGLTPDQALGLGWTTALHPDDRERIVTAWTQAVADGVDLDLEFRAVTADGTTSWLSGSASPLRDGRGTITGFVGVVSDISAAVETREALIAERQFVDTVLDIAGSLVCVFDPDGRFLRFNRACERISGYTFEEIKGRPFYDFLIPRDEIDGVRAALGRLRAGEPPEPNLNNWVLRDGSLRLISWSNASFFDERGSLTHIVSTGIDVTDERRAQDALRGIETVGRLLAKSGPSDASLTAVLRSLADAMGYRYLALALREGDRLELRAQLGYEALPTELDADRGIIGRVARSGEPALVRDVSADPDYVAGSPDVTSEIAVPISAEGQTLGVLNIESTHETPLSSSDLRLAQTIAERLATALVLGRDQQALADRARAFASLTTFARTANSTLGTEQLYTGLADAILAVMPADVLGLTVVDPASGRYLVRAVHGVVAPAAVGAEIRVGEGISGRAIESGQLTIAVLGRPQYPAEIKDLVDADTISLAGVPLTRDGVVLGAIALGRVTDREPAFSALETEVMALLAGQTALAIANARLLEEVSDLAIRDSLTGLFNRRHFDTAFDFLLTRRARNRGERRPVAAILFDLDSFGNFNKEHGHQAGDAVLRAFAAILSGRFRASDLLARYGGEEFVVVLEDATLADASRIADEIRRELEAAEINGPDGSSLRATVSAGCAALSDEEPTRDALLRAADVGLFMAKRAGRNQVVAV